MKMIFRLECPHCKWGQEMRDSYINQGWLEGKCLHCSKAFFFKATVTGVSLESVAELPQDYSPVKSTTRKLA